MTIMEDNILYKLKHSAQHQIVISLDVLIKELIELEKSGIKNIVISNDDNKNNTIKAYK